MLHATHQSASLAPGEHEAAGDIFGTDQSVGYISRHEDTSVATRHFAGDEWAGAAERR
jgi:hypothetical protein